MLILKNITLVSMSSVNIDSTINAILKSCEGIEFGDVKLITHEKPNDLPSSIKFCEIDRINNINEYSYNIIYKLSDYIETDYALIIQSDGYVINPSSWKEEFLEYDYIGAPFDLPRDNFSLRDITGNIFRVGNGGFSLRSKKLIDLPNKLNLEWKPFHGFYNEDGFICVNYRHEYIKHGCKFADINIAKYFSHENELPETKDIVPFAFHGKNKYKL
jgi:hypothetical protein